MQGSFTTEGDFGAFHTENARVATRGAKGGADRASGNETQLHQSVSEITG